MKRSREKFLALLFTAFLATSSARAADFIVSATFPTFTINGLANPTLTLQRGLTYTFSGGSAGHPFYIKSVQSTGTANQFTNGVTGNGLVGGTLTFAVPTNAPATLFYDCSIHSSMTGTINIVNPPTPPAFSIVSLAVNSNLSLRYTGTNTFTYTPEFKTNLAATNWFALTVQTNSFLTGTGEVICGLPTATNIFLRIRAQ